MIKNLLNIMLLCMLLTSCNNCTNPSQPVPNDAENDSVEVKFETYSYSDSLQVGEAWSYFDMHLQVPVGNSKLNKAVNEWLSNIILTNDSTPIPDYNELLKEECSRFFADNKEDVKGSLELDITPNPWSYTAETKAYMINDDFVTVEIDGYYHIGGAHGTPIQIGATFNRYTGERLTYESMLKTKENLNSMISYALAHGEDKYPIDDICEDNKCTVQTLPLPTDDPYIDEDAYIVFQYQPYEIGPYALGCPCARISFYDIYDFLKEPVNQIMPIDDVEDEDF